MEEALGSPPRERVPRIPLRKIEELDSDAPRTFSLWYRVTPQSPLTHLTNVSPEAAKVFCDRLRSDVEENKKSAIVNCNGTRDAQAFKDIFEWIDSCIVENKCVYFNTLEDSTPKLFSRYAKAVATANYLQIPARDFSEGLIKRLLITTKKVPMMDWDEVEFFYNNFADSPLREIAAHSIFWAWFNKDGKLGGTDEESGDDLAVLDNLRKASEQLDQDLHDKCKQNKVDVEARKEAKRLEKENQESAATGGDGFAGDEGYGGSGGGGGVGTGWDETAAPVTASGDWDNANNGGDEGYGDGDHNKENAAPGGGTGGGQDWAGANAAPSGDWADEVNTQDQYASTKW